MSLQAKHILMLILSAVSAVLASWTVAEFYENLTHPLLPVIILAVVVVVQILLTLKLKTPEERQIDLLRELQNRQIQGRMDVSAEVQKRIIEEVRNGNLKDAKRWDDFGKKIQ